jgi:hypothetical protein
MSWSSTRAVIEYRLAKSYFPDTESCILYARKTYIRKMSKVIPLRGRCKCPLGNGFVHHGRVSDARKEISAIKVKLLGITKCPTHRYFPSLSLCLTYAFAKSPPVVVKSLFEIHSVFIVVTSGNLWYDSRNKSILQARSKCCPRIPS